MSGAHQGFLIRIGDDASAVEHRLLKPVVLIGRSKKSDLVLDLEGLSRQHLEVRFDEKHILVKDLGSVNGSFINEKKLEINKDYVLDSSAKLYLGLSKIPMVISIIREELTQPRTSHSPQFALPPVPLETPAVPPPHAASDAMFRELRGELGELEARVVALQTEKRNLKSRVLELKAKSEHEEKKVLDLQSSLSQKQLELQASQLLSQKLSESIRLLSTNEQEVRERLDAVQGELTRDAAQLEQLQASKSVLVAETSQLEATVRIQQLRLTDTAKESEEISERIKTLDATRQSAQQELRSVEDQLSGTKTMLESEREKLSILQASVKTAEEHLAREKAALELEARRVRSELEVRSQEHQVAMLRLNVEVEEMRRTRAQLETEIVDLKRVKEQCLAEKADLLAQIQVNETELDKLELGIQNAQSRAEQVASENARVEKEAAQILKDCHEARAQILELQETRKRVNAEHVDLLKQLDDESHAKRRELEANEQQMRGRILAAAQDQEQKSKAQSEELISAANKKALEIDEAARLSAQQVMEAAQAQAAEIILAAQEKQSQAEAERRKAFLREEQDYAQQRDLRSRSLEEEFVKRRASLEQAFHADQLNFEEARRGRQRQEAAQLGHIAEKALRERIQSASQDESPSTIFARAFDEYLENLYNKPNKFKEEGFLANFRDRRFQKLLLGYSLKYVLPGLVVLVFAVSNSLRSSVTRTIASAFDPEQSNQQEYFKKILEERSRKPRYEPVVDDNFRATYSENLVYLRSYLSLQSDEDYRRAWVIALHDFLIKELGLDEKAVVKFSTQEGFMLTQLLPMRRGINPAFAEAGIKRMKELEFEMDRDLRDVVQTEKRYNKLREFEEKFYRRYLDENPLVDTASPNQPSVSPEE